jgi:acyl-CoA thioesterase
VNDTSVDSLLDASTPKSIDDGRYRWDVPDGWQQGRGAYGGLPTATLVRAAEAELEADDTPLRTLDATLCAPVLAEPARLTVEPLRRGSNTTAMAARVVQNDEVRVHAQLFFGRDRHEDGNWSTIEPPEPLRDGGGHPDEADVASMPEPLAPRFTQHFEYRPLEGWPFSGGDREVAGWVRPRRPGESRDAAYLAANVDAYWPAAYTNFEQPRPMATVSFHLQCLGGWEGLDDEAPLFYTSESPVARDGYCAESRKLWGRDGRLMAINEQSVCLIK